MLDTAPEQEYDDLARLASAVCGTPIGLVSLVDEDRQWFKAAIGLELKETPRDISFCTHAIAEDDLFEIGDASADPRFAHNELVTGDLNARFYAGVPLHSAGGEAVGTLCVIDTVPRHLTEFQRDALTILAAQVQSRFEMRQKQRALEAALREKSVLARRLERSQHIFRTFMDRSPNHIYLKDDHGCFVFYNRELADFYGIDQVEWIGRTLHDVLPKAEADRCTAQDERAIRCDQPIREFDERRGRDGSLSRFRIIKFTYEDLDGHTMLGGISVDVTELIRQTEALNRANSDLALLVTTDLLTGLSSRRAFCTEAEAAYRDWKRHGRPLSILVLDIDNFKHRNDTFGHACGDEALRVLGRVLKGSVRAGDIVARIGGEEFGVLLPGTEVASALEVAQRFQAALKQEDHGPLPLTVSLGVAAMLNTMTSWEQLLAHADEAMYEAKRGGKDRVIAWQAP